MPPLPPRLPSPPQDVGTTCVREPPEGHLPLQPAVAAVPATPFALQGLPARRRDEARQELEDLRAHKRSAPMQTHEIQLAAYLVAREVLERPVTDPGDLRRLKDGTRSMQATRDLMPHGRGNVDTDLAQTRHDSFYRTSVSRRLSQAKPVDIGHPDRPLAGLAPQSRKQWQGLCAAGAVAAGAGNCGEHAVLAAHLHANSLRGRESVVMVSDDEHAWCEVRTPKHPTVVVDAWKEGSAMLEEDTCSTPLAVDHVIRRRGARYAVKAMRKAGHALSTPQLQQYIQRQLERERALQTSPPERWEPQPLAAAGFAQRAGQALQSHSALALEALAVDIARTRLDAGIGPAARAAPAIVQTARALDTVRRAPLPDYPPPSRRRRV